MACCPSSLITTPACVGVVDDEDEAVNVPGVY